jgi:phosphatidylserine/phosphatidylglycerophosphate/cardiolipin synthase-like enzyme
LGVTAKRFPDEELAEGECRNGYQIEQIYIHSKLMIVDNLYP